MPEPFRRESVREPYMFTPFSSQEEKKITKMKKLLKNPVPKFMEG